MASWKLIVENYGKIKSAEIEVAPLTLFVGDNNSGKSYLLALLWGIEHFGVEELMIKDFIEYSANVIQLDEQEDTGKSELNFQVISNNNLIIRNVDKKRTEMYFFQNSKVNSMFKRVDHIIFENLSDNNWKIHLIEMKPSVGNEKWNEVKGKFRASYLLVQGIVAMLEMNILETCMYTTYEKVNLSLPETMPSARRLSLGNKLVSP